MSAALGAVAVAVAAAALLGGSSVAQRRAMATVGTHDAGDVRLVRVLATRGWWWAGTLASVVGLGLQVLALTLGPLVTVQITMTSSIVAATLAEWWLLGRRPGRRIWSGIALTTTGLATAVLALSPTAAAASAMPSATSMVAAAAACTAVIGGAVGLDRRAVRRARAGSGPAPTGVGLAVATGVGYGLTAVALKSVGMQLADGRLVPLGHPALYLAAVLGPLSVLLSQHALQRGRRVVATVSLILVIDPLVGLLAGTVWFGERVAGSPAAVATAVAAAVAVVGGIVLTQRGPVADDAASFLPDSDSDRDGTSPAETTLVVVPSSVPER